MSGPLLKRIRTARATVPKGGPTDRVLEDAHATILRYAHIVDQWDDFHDECFPDDPYMRGRVMAEIERMNAGGAS